MLLDLLTLNNDAERRTFILKEIVQTEENYVEELTILVNHFAKPLKDTSKNILKEEEWKQLFSNIELIQLTNQFFLQTLKKKLQKHLEEPLHTSIGDVFSKFIDKFVSYSDYSMN